MGKTWTKRKRTESKKKRGTQGTRKTRKRTRRRRKYQITRMGVNEYLEKEVDEENYISKEYEMIYRIK